MQQTTRQENEGPGGKHTGVDRPSCLDSPVGAGRSVAVTRTRRGGARGTVDGRSGGSRRFGSRRLDSRHFGFRHWRVVGARPRARVKELPHRTSRTVEASLMVAREREKACERGLMQGHELFLKLATAANVAVQMVVPEGKHYFMLLSDFIQKMCVIMLTDTAVNNGCVVIIRIYRGLSMRGFVLWYVR